MSDGEEDLGQSPPAKRMRRESGEPGEEDSNTPIKMDNSREVVTKIASLYAERLMSDVLLVVGDEELPAHRLILCASSDVFQVMLMNSTWSESQEKRIVLKETPACAAVFEVFLKYLYTGKIQVNYANVIPMLQLADKYNVKDLLQLGLDFMARNVAIAAKRNQIVSWYQFATNCGYKDTSQLCLDFIKWNFEMVTESIDWPNMEHESLVKLLNCSDLVVHDEMVVFLKVEKWLEEQQRRMEETGEEDIDLHMENLVTSAINCVRFPMMYPAQLADLLLSPIIKTYMSFMMERMSMAMAYHRRQPGAVQRILEKLQSGDRLLTPRLYTEDKYCASLSVDYFPQLPVYHCRSLMFSAQEDTAAYSGDTANDWMVDLYPKGVWFQKCFKIFHAGAMQEVPERVLRTVRVSVSTKEESERRVKIGVLVVGDQEGFEHIRHVRSTNYIFSENDQIVNLDNLLSFDELNDMKQRSNFLSGVNKESFKIHITITPLHKNSSLSIP